jgi:hypothetical protein
MRKKVDKSLKPFYPALIQQQMRVAYEALVDDHRKVVHNYEQQIKRNKNRIEDQDRLIQAYQECAQVKDRLLAKHYEMFETLQQQFPETRELLGNMDL